jgi:hypothetical protein
LILVKHSYSLYECLIVSSKKVNLKLTIQLPKTIDQSEVLLSVGRIILHFRYNRQKDDNYQNWYIGIVKPTKRYDSQIHNEITDKIENLIDLNSLVHFKVLGKNIAEQVVKKLVKNGFSRDRIFVKYDYHIEPVSRYHVLVYRKPAKGD